MTKDNVVSSHRLCRRSTALCGLRSNLSSSGSSRFALIKVSEDYDGETFRVRAF